MAWSLGWSSGAQAITPDVYLCSNASVSATAATSSRTSPWLSRSPRQVVGRGLSRACPPRDELNQHRPRPARDLVQVRADARDLPGALALDLARRRGPGLRPRHRLAQQLGQRHARRGGLGLPGGQLGRAHAGMSDGWATGTTATWH